MTPPSRVRRTSGSIRIEIVLRARRGDVEQPALLAVARALVQRAAGREHAVHHPQDKNDIPFQALGLVNRAQPDAVRRPF